MDRPTGVWRILVTALAMFCASVAARSNPPERNAPASEIVITGHAKHALRNFVESLAKVGPTGQISRWDGHVCPTVIGLQNDQARFMEQRILDIARWVHLRPWKSGCATSFIVVFAPDADASAAALVNDYGGDFRSDSSSGAKTFLNSSRPIRWIGVSSECGGNGCELLRGRLPNSRLVKATKPVLQAIVIVVDARRITGFSLGELSDFIALVGLTNPNARRTEPSRSILSMFDVPRLAGARFHLTDYDKAFLAGVYDTRLDDLGASQKATIVGRMKKEIDRDASDEAGGQSPD